MATAFEQMKIAEKVLDEYEINSKVPINISPGTEEELQEYLNMDRDTISKLSCLDCGEISIRLSQYANYIQRLSNRESARVTWANGAILKGAASVWGNYSDYIKYDIKISLIAKDNSYVDTLSKIICKAEQRVDRLKYVSSSIIHISNVIEKQQRYKQSEK